MVRIVLAVVGGAVAGVVTAVVEGSVGVPTLAQLLAIMGAIVLVLLLTAARWGRTGDDPVELLRQLDHHRRELYRLQSRYQRKGVLTAAEVGAWFRNKRALTGLKRQLQKAETPYPPDPIDGASPPAPVGLLTRAREFLRQPAVSLFIVLFLVSLALAYPLSAATQYVFGDYLATAGSPAATEEPGSAPVAGVTATDTPPATNTATPTETAPTRPPSSTPTATSQATDEPTTPATATATVATPSPTSTGTTSATATSTLASTETPTAAATATSQPTSTPSPPGTPLPTLPPAPTARPTFLPVETLPPECDEATGEVEPNSTFETAQGPLAPETTLCGYLDDVYDFYYVEVSAPGQLTVTLQNVEMEPGTPPLNLLKLFTAEPEPMDWCCISRRDRIELTVAVSFGRYYIVVDARELVGLPYVLVVGYEAGG